MGITMEDKIKILLNKKEEFIGNNTTVTELIQSRGLKKAARFSFSDLTDDASSPRFPRRYPRHKTPGLPRLHAAFHNSAAHEMRWAPEEGLPQC